MTDTQTGILFAGVAITLIAVFFAWRAATRGSADDRAVAFVFFIFGPCMVLGIIADILLVEAR